MLDSHPGTVEIAPVEVTHSVIGIPVVVEFLSKIESNVLNIQTVGFDLFFCTVKWHQDDISWHTADQKIDFVREKMTIVVTVT